MATQQETRERQLEHIGGGGSTKLYSEAVVCEIAQDDELRGMGYVTIRILDPHVFNKLTNKQILTVKFEVES